MWRGGGAARVTAEGSKMAGASWGTAQQRAFTQEGVNGGRKGPAWVSEWLTSLFNTGTDERTKRSGYALSNREIILGWRMNDCLRSNLYIAGHYSMVFAAFLINSVGSCTAGFITSYIKKRNVNPFRTLKNDPASQMN